jgi:hypothetical protein
VIGIKPSATLAIILMVALTSTGFAQPVPGAATAAPQEVLAFLPAGVEVRSAFLTALEGNSQQQWVVHGETPWNVSSPPPNAYLVVARQADAGWNLATQMSLEWVIASYVGPLPVEDRPALFFSAGVGAHGSRLTVLRWDGSGYATVFARESNTPGLVPRDLNQDGTPEIIDSWSPYCGGYAASPKLVTVYRWSGGVYAEATAAFPDFVRGIEPAFRAALAESGDWEGAGWTASDRACLHWSLGYIAERSGRPDDAAREYNQASQLDPAYTRDAHPPALLFEGIIDRGISVIGAAEG